MPSADEAPSANASDVPVSSASRHTSPAERSRQRCRQDRLAPIRRGRRSPASPPHTRCAARLPASRQVSRSHLPSSPLALARLPAAQAPLARPAQVSLARRLARPSCGFPSRLLARSQAAAPARRLAQSPEHRVLATPSRLAISLSEAPSPATCRLLPGAVCQLASPSLSPHQPVVPSRSALLCSVSTCSLSAPSPPLPPFRRSRAAFTPPPRRCAPPRRRTRSRPAPLSNAGALGDQLPHRIHPLPCAAADGAPASRQKASDSGTSAAAVRSFISPPSHRRGSPPAG